MYQRASQYQIIITLRSAKLATLPIIQYQAVFLKYVNLYNLLYWGAHNQPRVSILVSAMAMILFSWGTFWFSVMFMYEV